MALSRSMRFADCLSMIWYLGRDAKFKSGRPHQSSIFTHLELHDLRDIKWIVMRRSGWNASDKLPTGVKLPSLWGGGLISGPSPESEWAEPSFAGSLKSTAFIFLHAIQPREREIVGLRGSRPQHDLRLSSSGGQVDSGTCIWATQS